MINLKIELFYDYKIMFDAAETNFRAQNMCNIKKLNLTQLKPVAQYKICVMFKIEIEKMY